MKIHSPNADIFVPDGSPLPAALARTTHLAVGAHQDDVEFFAFHGIAECLDRPDRGFTAVICTDGAGSARTGPYAACTDTEIRRLRLEEQRRAAGIGGYAAVVQLGYSSAGVKNPADPRCTEDLAAIFSAARPATVYLHNPADKHDTHVAVFLRCLEALRRLPPREQPAKVYGCEVWRDLDWLVDSDKVVLPVSARPDLQASLNGVFQSQIAGGKHYDTAVMGRRHAQATFFDSHATDRETGLTFAMDLTPLVHDPRLSVEEFVSHHIDRLRDDVIGRLRRLEGHPSPGAKEVRNP
jgi:LmbE family N-acetylglucosaminyl deacetylase